MKHIIPTEDVTRLVRSAERLARLAQAIAEQTQSAVPVAPVAVVAKDCPAAAPASQHLVQAARDAMAAHLAKPDFGAPTLFRNRPWLLMLELFAAKLSGQIVPVKSACLTLGGATSTALRTILELEQLGLIASTSDVRDARRRLLRLTTSAETALETHLTQHADRRDPPLRLSLKLSHRVVGSEQDIESSTMQPYPAPSNSERDVVFQ